MKVSNNRKQRIIKFLNGRTFYAVLCVCFIAIGVASWSAVESIKGINSAEENGGAKRPDNISVPYATESGSGESNPKPESKIAKSDSEKTAKTESKTAKAQPEQAEETSATEATYFVNPVLGKIIKHYSDTELQYSQTFCDMRLHKGTDIAADIGTPVSAAGNGIVTSISSDPALGNIVEIDHGNGIKAKYCGLNATPSVAIGDAVDSSTQIGVIDTVPSESVEQHHLHIEFTSDGKSVSPEKYITE